MSRSAIRIRSSIEAASPLLRGSKLKRRKRRRHRPSQHASKDEHIACLCQPCSALTSCLPAGDFARARMLCAPASQWTRCSHKSYATNATTTGARSVQEVNESLARRAPHDGFTPRASTGVNRSSARILHPHVVAGRKFCRDFSMTPKSPSPKPMSAHVGFLPRVAASV